MQNILPILLGLLLTQLLWSMVKPAGHLHVPSMQIELWVQRLLISQDVPGRRKSIEGVTTSGLVVVGN